MHSVYLSLIMYMYMSSVALHDLNIKSYFFSIPYIARVGYVNTFFILDFCGRCLPKVTRKVVYGQDPPPRPLFTIKPRPVLFQYIKRKAGLGSGAEGYPPLPPFVQRQFIPQYTGNILN